MGEKRAYKPRKPGGGRKKLKPEYDAGKNLKEQMESAVALYEEDCSDRRKLLESGAGLCWCEIQNLLRVAIYL